MREIFITCPHPDGTHRISVTEWGTASALPPIICVHGLTRNGRDFDALARALSDVGRHVFCPTMAGRGASDDLPDPALYGYPQYIGDMLVLMQHIAQTTGAKQLAGQFANQIDWVGTSMGGLIGMFMASAPQSSIRRMVINDVGPYLTAESLKHIGSYTGQETKFATLGELEQHMRTIYASFGIQRDEDWQDMASHSFRRTPDGQYTLAHDVGIARNFLEIKENVDLWEAYDRIACPTLVIHGMQSEILPTAIAQQMTQRGPKAELIDIPDVGHAPALIDVTQIAVIRKFLSLG